ncbi:MAG TPA: hypothetical protein VEF76_07635 [Patescibacteria group bacterium]|nr:hypothetical protein [Patescibacteria group bacterium]
MTRNQQWIIIAIAAIVGSALVIGIIKKKYPELLQRKPAASGPATAGGAPAATDKPVKYYTGAPPAPRGDYDPKLNGIMQGVVGQMRMLGAAIGNAAQRKRIALEDLEKLHFGGVSDKVDPAYAVFNPDGRIKFRPLMGAWIDQATLDRVTTAKNMRLYYSLRRQTDASGTTDTLFAVIPNPTEKFCRLTRLSLKAKQQLTFAADNTKPVAEAPGTFTGEALLRPSCILSTDNRLYWFAPLASRFLAPGGTMWQKR